MRFVCIALLALFACLVGSDALARQDASVVSPTSTGDSPDAVVVEARQRIAAGQFLDAVQVLQGSIRDDDGSDPTRLARRLGTLGVALNQAGAIGEAIVVQHQALALYESIDDPAGRSAITTNLGNSLSALGDRAGARHYFEEALALKQRHGISRGVGVIENNLADLDETEGKLVEARHALERALSAYAAEQNPRGECLARGNYARVLAKLGEHVAAQEQIRLAEALATAQDYLPGTLATLIAHADTLLAYVDRMQPVPDERERLLRRAEDSLQQALGLSRGRDDLEHEIATLDDLVRVRERQGDPAAALALVHTLREREQSQRERLSNTRAAVLSVRYEHDRQQREIERLRERENATDARVLRLRHGLWLLGALLLAASAAAFVFGRGYRRHRVDEADLRAHNQTLSGSLAQVEQERQRSEALALRQRRFLRLASDDLREPLLEIRTLAERSLVEESPELMRRHHAGIAQRAADLLWVTDQMLESAEHDITRPAEQRRETLDLVVTLRELVEEASQRALHNDQELLLECALEQAMVRIEPTRCAVALRELIDIVLYLNPARARLRFSLTRVGDDFRIGLDSGVARLPDWNDIALGQDEGDVTLRLALAWIQHAIQDNGGRIRGECRIEDSRREIVIHFPATPEPVSPPSA